jgi:hypothetical protein
MLASVGFRHQHVTLRPTRSPAAWRAHPLSRPVEARTSAPIDDDNRIQRGFDPTLNSGSSSASPVRLAGAHANRPLLRIGRSVYPLRVRLGAPAIMEDAGLRGALHRPRARYRGSRF